MQESGWFCTDLCRAWGDSEAGGPLSAGEEAGYLVAFAWAPSEEALTLFSKSPGDTHVQFWDLTDCHNSTVLVGQARALESEGLGLPEVSCDPWGMLTFYSQCF